MVEEDLEKHCPAKGKLLVWSILENKLPNCDNLQNQIFFGLGLCALCKTHLETMEHIFLQCSFLRDVWEFSRILMLTLRYWQGNTFESALESWLCARGHDEIMDFPIILAWGIWITQNRFIFHDEFISSERVAINSIGILVSLHNLGGGDLT